MSVSADYLAYVVDQLTPFARITSRRMFGGVGLYADEFFFALIADDCLYFKVDDSNRPDFTARGCEPFVPFPDDPRKVSMSYYQVPADILEDSDELSLWARKAQRAAAASAAAKAAKRPVGRKTGDPVKRRRSARKRPR